MAMKILASIMIDKYLKQTYFAYQQSKKQTYLLQFLRKPDMSGDIYSRYFAPKPEVDVKLSNGVKAKVKSILAVGEKDIKDRVGNLDKKIATERAVISEAMKEVTKLKKTDKKGSNKKDIAAQEKIIKAKSAIVKKFTGEKDNLIKQRASGKLRLDMTPFKKLMKEVQNDLVKYLEGPDYKAFLKSRQYDWLRCP